MRLMADGQFLFIGREYGRPPLSRRRALASRASASAVPASIAVAKNQTASRMNFGKSFLSLVAA